MRAIVQRRSQRSSGWRRTLADTHQVLRSQPLAERLLHGDCVQLDVVLCRTGGLIERQPKVGASQHAACDLVHAGLAERELTQQTRLDARELIATYRRVLHG